MPDHDIRRLVEAYFNALDARDLEGVGRCFATDAQAIYYAGTPAEVCLKGDAAILRQLAAVVGGFTASVHVLANASYEVSAKSGHARVHAVANVAIGDTILVRGLRYTLRFDELADGWRIAELIHHQLFQYEAASVRPQLPAAGE